MIRTVSCGVLVAAMVVSACTANAAPTSPVMPMDEAERASSIETRHSRGAAAPVAVMKTQRFANGEMLVSWDDQQVLALCERAVYLKIPPGKVDAASLTTEQRQMIAYQALMAGQGSVAAVAGLAGESVAVADDGSETRRAGEGSWAYGVERYDVATQRMGDGALRIRARKTATVNNAASAAPDDTFSTEDDQAARLSELAPVGSWTEVVIYGGPQQVRMDPAMSLKGWISLGDEQPATVAEARRLHGCK